MYGFLQFAPDNKLVIDISFESATGYSLVLARAFYGVSISFINTYIGAVTSDSYSIYHNSPELHVKKHFNHSCMTYIVGAVILYADWNTIFH